MEDWRYLMVNPLTIFFLVLHNSCWFWPEFHILEPWIPTNRLTNDDKIHYVKCVRIQSFSSPYFFTFGLNMVRYSVCFRIQSEWGKIWTRKTPNTGTFHAVIRPFLEQVSVRICKSKQLPCESQIHLSISLIQINLENIITAGFHEI